jgi:hypothetical protein
VLVAAAFCPHPPLLVPELAGSVAGELDSLRAACAAAVERLVRARPELLCVLGPGPDTHAYPPGANGSLAGYGLERQASLGPRTADFATLPLSLTIGGYLLEGAAYDGALVGQAVAASASAEDCARLGRSLAEGRRLGLLVLGDGSARRVSESPGAFDPRGEPFDRELGRILAAADVTAMRALDPGLADAVLSGGRAAWQVAAGAAGAEPLVGELLYAEAPYDVGYFVASWARR